MTFLDLIDTLRDSLSEAIGVAADDSVEQPYDWTPGILYLWEESAAMTPIGGQERREDFVLVAAIAEPTGEEAAGQRSRETTEALYAHRDALLEWIRENPSTDAWDHIVGASIPSYLRQLDARGIAIRISGYRLIG